MCFAWITLLNERAATSQRAWRKRFLRRARRRNDKMAFGFGMTRWGRAARLVSTGRE
jgi:hypothetical protein